jgi:hypothetical protein
MQEWIVAADSPRNFGNALYQNRGTSPIFKYRKPRTNLRPTSVKFVGVFGETMWYSSNMTKQQVKQLLDRVLDWPSQRQEVAVHILSAMEEQDTSSYRLTEEQVAEVQRRLADPNPKFLSLEEVRERFSQRHT